MSIVSQILANPDRYSVQELQQGMQSGMIPGYVAIPLIQDKVKKQQLMQMAQQGQGAPGEEAPTVAEDVLQQADQSQGLPMLESNLPAEEQSYAPGGIVAFEHGGPVKHFKVGGLDIDPEDYSDFSSSALLGPDYERTSEGIAALKAPKFSDDAAMAAVERFAKITGGLPGSKEDIGKLRTLLEQRSAQAAEDAKTAKERNIIGLLANIAANPSQYSSVAIGAGTAKSLPEFAAAEAAQRKQQMEDAMAGLSLTKAEREEAMANITGGMGLYKTELEEMGREYTADARIRAARIAAGKAHQNEMSQWMDAHVAAERERIANGERKPVSDAILRQEAGLALFKTRQQPQMAAVAQRDTEAAGTLDARLRAIEESGLNRATDAVTAATNNLRTVEGKEMKRIGKEQGPAAALQYKNQLIRDLAAGKITLSTPGSAASTQAPAPKAASVGAAMASYQDYDKLKSGTRFIDPQGNVRVKP